MNIIMKMLLCLLVVVVPLNILCAQVVRNMQLKNSRVDYIPRTFYLSAVVDERANKELAGTITGGGSGTEKLIMQNGVAASLERFIAANIRQDKSKQAIVLHIQQLDLKIDKKSNHWHINCNAKFAFYAGDKLLVELSGGGHGDINNDPIEYVERYIRETLEGDMKKFDTWWGQNGDKIPTASTVKVNFVIARTTEEPECIVYSAQRPLRVSDFQGPTMDNYHDDGNITEMAATYSGNKYAYRIAIEKGQTVVNYTITSNFNKSKSWFKKSEHNDRVLAHEQLHFDITALVTCQWIDKMRNITFTKDNYEAILDKLAGEISDDTNDMQGRYDSETNHGIIEEQQLAWELKIKEQLKQAACY